MGSKKSKRVGKTIRVDSDTAKLLQLQAIERKGVLYKSHCEDILEKASKMSSEEVMVWLSPLGKSKKNSKMLEGGRKEVVTSNDTDVKSAENESKGFDGSGVFKKVEDKIYTNKKCFELRKWSQESGIERFYFGTLVEAQKSKNI